MSKPNESTVALPQTARRQVICLAFESEAQYTKFVAAPKLYRKWSDEQYAQLRLYDLRHTTATLLLASNVHPKIVGERLGHSSITLTLDTYSHVLPGMQADATAQLESLLFENVGTL